MRSLADNNFVQTYKNKKESFSPYFVHLTKSREEDSFSMLCYLYL